MRHRESKTVHLEVADSPTGVEFIAMKSKGIGTVHAGDNQAADNQVSLVSVPRETLIPTLAGLRAMVEKGNNYG